MPHESTDAQRNATEELAWNGQFISKEIILPIMTSMNLYIKIF